jgi:hypothetical protein
VFGSNFANGIAAITVFLSEGKLSSVSVGTILGGFLLLIKTDFLSIAHPIFFAFCPMT